MGIFWLIEKSVKKENIPQLRFKTLRELSNPDAIENQKHIMISYNQESRDLCEKIKNELEKIGYKIWIDLKSANKLSLDSIAEAIENSSCVLICMTEKYKQSSDCRAEAEYAFQLNKPIIPLIMQKDYKPDGW